MKVCDDMGIHPVSYIVNNLEQKELKLRFHGLGPLSIKAISIPLEVKYDNILEKKPSNKAIWFVSPIGVYLKPVKTLSEDYSETYHN